MLGLEGLKLSSTLSHVVSFDKKLYLPLAGERQCGVLKVILFIILCSHLFNKHVQSIYLFVFIFHLKNT